jgi:hypothetical protein
MEPEEEPEGATAFNSTSASAPATAFDRNGAGGTIAYSNSLRTATDSRRLSLSKSAKATDTFTQSLLALGPNQQLGALIHRPSLPLPYLLPELIEAFQTEMKALEEALEFYESSATANAPISPLEAE